jgi:hypothetical protein
LIERKRYLHCPPSRLRQTPCPANEIQS